MNAYGVGLSRNAYDAREFKNLECIYPEFSFSAWKDLICIKKVSKEGVSWKNGGNDSKAFLGVSN